MIAGLAGLQQSEAAIASFYQEIILRRGHDNSELLDMTNTNMVLSPQLVLNLLSFMLGVAAEVESPGQGNLSADKSSLLRDMTREQKRKKMASLLMLAEGLVRGRNLAPLEKSCLQLATQLQTICNRFLSSC